MTTSAEKMRRWMENPANREKKRQRDMARRRAGGAKPRATADDLAAAFWAKTIPNGDCLDWTGWKLGKPGSEYGVVRRRPGRALAHRMAYELTFGPIGSALFVCHRCDNPKRVKPEHLFLGTQTDNMRDCATKGRLRGTFAKGRDQRIAKGESA